MNVWEGFLPSFTSVLRCPDHNFFAMFVLFFTQPYNVLYQFYKRTVPGRFAGAHGPPPAFAPGGGVGADPRAGASAPGTEKVAQLLVRSPLTARGRKFDMRWFVLVRSFVPFEAWGRPPCGGGSRRPKAGLDPDLLTPTI